MYYITTDYLGSISEITDETGNMLQRIQYNPWGKRTIAYTDPAYTDFILDRGFTGHEHLDMFQLINMNGRLYDYDLGVMLSPDNYVQAPDFSQNYNRYSYCWNNPLKYTDPDGDFVWFVVGGAILGGYIGGSIQQGTAAFWDWDSDFHKQGDFWKSVGIGAIVGAGAGATFAAGFGASGTGFGAGFSSQSGAASVTSLGWDISSNALLTANTNMLSTWTRGGDRDDVLVSGGVGLVAGGIGGAAGHFHSNSKYTPWKEPSIKFQNYFTSGLNGFGDRFMRTYIDGDKENAWKSGIIGIGEGLLTAHFVGNKNIFINSGNNANNALLLGRYKSSFVSQSIISVPRLGIELTSASLIRAGFLLTSDDVLLSWMLYSMFSPIFTNQIINGLNMYPSYYPMPFYN